MNIFPDSLMKIKWYWSFIKLKSQRLDSVLLSFSLVSKICNVTFVHKSSFTSNPAVCVWTKIQQQSRLLQDVSRSLRDQKTPRATQTVRVSRHSSSPSTTERLRSAQGSMTNSAHIPLITKGSTFHTTINILYLHQKQDLYELSCSIITAEEMLHAAARRLAFTTSERTRTRLISSANETVWCLSHTWILEKQEWQSESLVRRDWS